MGFLDGLFGVFTHLSRRAANHDWRLLTWLLTLEIVLLSLCAVYFLGVEVWYRMDERGRSSIGLCNCQPPKEHFSDLTLPDPLGDERRAASWTESDERGC